MTDRRLDAIEQELHEVVSLASFPLASSPLYSEFLTMLHYHLGWTDREGKPVSVHAGKRMRPLLLLYAAQAAGGDWESAVPAAAAIELVHNFSLIHDDIEDDSADRHGRSTVWKVWGLAHGINAGDAMFALARLALDRLSGGFAPASYAAVHGVFDRATLALTQGQYLDLSYEEQQNVTLPDYVEMVRGKTGALLAATCEIGARLATEDNRTAGSLARYGENLGIAFQIADDVLGIWGDPAVTGKSARSDILARKKSLPLLYGASADTTGAIAAFFRRSLPGPAEAERIQQLLDRAGAREYAEREAGKYVSAALTALQESGLEGPAVGWMRQLAAGVVGRVK